MNTLRITRCKLFCFQSGTSSRLLALEISIGTLGTGLWVGRSIDGLRTCLEEHLTRVIGMNAWGLFNDTYEELPAVLRVVLSQAALDLLGHIHATPAVHFLGGALTQRVPVIPALKVARSTTINDTLRELSKIRDRHNVSGVAIKICDGDAGHAFGTLASIRELLGRFAPLYLFARQCRLDRATLAQLELDTIIDPDAALLSDWSCDTPLLLSKPDRGLSQTLRDKSLCGIVVSAHDANARALEQICAVAATFKKAVAIDVSDDACATALAAHLWAIQAHVNAPLIADLSTPTPHWLDNRVALREGAFNLPDLPGLGVTLKHDELDAASAEIRCFGE